MVERFDAANELRFAGEKPKRLRLEGHHLAQSPSVKVIHHGGQGRSRFSQMESIALGGTELVMGQLLQFLACVERDPQVVVAGG